MPRIAGDHLRDATSVWADSAYLRLADVLRDRAGLIFQPLRRPIVEAAAARVMLLHRIASPELLVPLVAQGGAIFDDILAEVTIGETYFFRESAHFTLLRTTVLPAFRSRRTSEQKFRAWSAGCSTGEEPYSIAIALREEGIPGYVVGTDISRARLATARLGRYRKWSFRGVPDEVVDRYFRHADDSYQLKPDVRREAEFRYLNLAKDSYPSMSTGVWGMDFILCRNVLIYFDGDTIARVAKALLASLSEEGWLVLGATDPPLDNIARCEVMQTEAGIAYRQHRRARIPAGEGDTLPTPSPVRSHSTPRTAPTPARESNVVPTANPAAVGTGSGDTTQRVVEREQTAIATEAYRARDYERTIAIVTSTAATGDAPMSDLVLRVRALANLGRLEEADLACAAALDRHRDSPQLHYLHAILVLQSGLFAESARAAKRALYLDQTMIVAQVALGTALARARDDAGARRAFAAAERMLLAMTPEQEVPDSDGEPAGRLLEITRAQFTLSSRAAREQAV